MISSRELSGDPSSPNFDIDQCSFEIGCPIETSFYGYIPNRGANIFFTSVYGLIILACLYFTIRRWPAWRGYTIVLGIGAGFELAGFNLRTYGTENPWEIQTFTYQLVFITIAPVFMSASIYLSLEYISERVGRGWFKIPPKLYPRFFIPMDIIALVIQAVGGAKSTGDKEPTDGGMSLGVKITVIGLVIQLVSLFVFFIFLMAIVVPHADGIRGRRPLSDTYALSANGQYSGDESASERKPRQARVTVFVAVIAIATFLIVVRSGYRVAELYKGVSGGLMTNEAAFMVADGALILVASLLLAFGHPTLTIRDY